MPDPISSPDSSTTPLTAALSERRESEEDLIVRAQTALSACRWVVGECAHQWTKRYAKGRTDADFGTLIGLSADQVFQRRRVWQTFADVYGGFSNLRWSHFYAALNWDDSAECLQWAEETQATVLEMKAWRRAQRGEDLTVEGDEPEAIANWVGDFPAATAFVQDPADFEEREGGMSRERSGDLDSAALAMAGHPREMDGGDYAPFRQGAMTVPSSDSGGPDTLDSTSPEQLARKLAGALERCSKVITPEFVRAFRQLPEQLRNRVLTAAVGLDERLDMIR